MPLRELMAAGFAKGAFSRALKRMCKIDVTLDDYDALWAETTIDGAEQVTKISDGRELIPEYRLYATRMEVGGGWHVVKQRFIPLKCLPLSDEFNTKPAYQRVPHVFATIGHIGRNMSDHDMLLCLRRADSTVRKAGHVSRHVVSDIAILGMNDSKQVQADSMHEEAIVEAKNSEPLQGSILSSQDIILLNKWVGELVIQDLRAEDIVAKARTHGYCAGFDADRRRFVISELRGGPKKGRAQVTSVYGPAGDIISQNVSQHFPSIKRV